MLIDSHAHITYESLNTRQIIKDMKKDNLYAIINVCSSVKDGAEIIKLATQNENIYAAIGVHPEHAEEYNPKEFEKLVLASCKNPKVVAIGEIGLDYHYTKDNKELQKQVFISQLKLAAKAGLPVIIHMRDAFDDMISILKQNINLLDNSGVMHCFSGDAEMAKEFVKLGFYISFSGTITFKKQNTDVLHAVPQDRLLVETDCPFLSPEPFRGKVNTPKNIHFVAEKIANVLGIEKGEFKQLTINNTKALFKKIK